MSCETAAATATGMARVVAARALSFVELALWQPPKASSRIKIAPNCIHCQFRFLFMCLTVEEPHKRRAAQTVNKFVAELIQSFAVHLPFYSRILGRHSIETGRRSSSSNLMVPGKQKMVKVCKLKILRKKREIIKHQSYARSCTPYIRNVESPNVFHGGVTAARLEPAPASPVRAEFRRRPTRRPEPSPGKRKWSFVDRAIAWPGVRCSAALFAR